MILYCDIMKNKYSMTKRMMRNATGWCLPTMSKLSAFATLLAMLGLLSAADAVAQPAEDHWTFALTPYLWSPNINGTLKYSVPPGAAGSPEVTTGPNNYLQNLQTVLMLAGEARENRWSVNLDTIYLDFADQKSSVKSVNFGGSIVNTSLNASTSSSLTGWLWTLTGGYTAVQNPRATLDVVGGIRYLRIKASTDWQLSATVSGPGAGQVFPASGNISERTDITDAIVGARGQIRLGDGNWRMPYYFDVGTGSSTRTWQGLLGITYAFKWGEAELAYRHLAYDQGNDKLLQTFRFSGPAFGAVFHF